MAEQVQQVRNEFAVFRISRQKPRIIVLVRQIHNVRYRSWEILGVRGCVDRGEMCRWLERKLSSEYQCCEQNYDPKPSLHRRSPPRRLAIAQGRLYVVLSGASIVRSTAGSRPVLFASAVQF